MMKNCDALAFVESLFGHADSALDVDALALERLISVGAVRNIWLCGLLLSYLLSVPCP